ncbi:type II toxin-antitoxin system Phd/YefM family antitoxin [Candidatus Palauibacter sp.]|uniref:type II toxin-antitoxin system Phd/YefM family antitoxin n=1 Tax=Candidatus Palauibacter sp. TaxID=3101350 RepID=UPI003B02B134
MESVGVSEAKVHFAELLKRVMAGESVTITRYGHPVARLVPVEVEEDERALARAAARRILERRRRLKNKASLEELLATVHEGHRY